MGDKKGDGKCLFDNFSNGVKTQRDSWCYNASESGLKTNMMRMIAFYNQEVDRFSGTFSGLDKKAKETKVDDFINTDPAKISWSDSLKNELVKDRRYAFETDGSAQAMYRPFTKQWMYYNRRFNERLYQMPRIFPYSGAENRAILVKGNLAETGQIALMVNTVVDLQPDRGAQCFPLYLYDEAEKSQSDDDRPSGTKDQSSLFPETSNDLFEVADAQPAAPRYQRRDALTDEGLTHFQEVYPGETVGKEDVFYYVYGLLHSPDYRERYADNLGKELPRIPCVKAAADFQAFSLAGRQLAELHLNYETVEPYPVDISTGGKSVTDADYRVEKMKYGKKGKDKDLTTLHYNAKITLTGIPLEAYEYVVNGKPALDWVVERQCVKTDKDSGIVNDANDWAIETMGNPRYPLELFQRIITVSLETMKIVKALPALDI